MWVAIRTPTVKLAGQTVTVGPMSSVGLDVAWSDFNLPGESHKSLLLDRKGWALQFLVHKPLNFRESQVVSHRYWPSGMPEVHDSVKARANFPWKIYRQ